MKVLVLDENGHSEFAPTTSLEALTKIQEYPNRWVFADGVFVNETNSVSANDIEEADEIVITAKLVGG